MSNNTGNRSNGKLVITLISVAVFLLASGLTIAIAISGKLLPDKNKNNSSGGGFSSSPSDSGSLPNPGGAGNSSYESVDDFIPVFPGGDENSQDTSAKDPEGLNPGDVAGENSAETASQVAVPPLGAGDKPSVMRASLWIPGENFLLNPDQETVGDVYGQIDKLFEDTKLLSFNTVIVGLNLDGRVIYNSGQFAGVHSEDYFRYIIQKAEENKLYVYALYEPLAPAPDGSETDGSLAAKLQTFTGASMDALRSEAEDFASAYEPSGFIITGYDNPVNGGSYGSYSAFGMSMGFENYLRSCSETAVRAISDTLRAVRPKFDIGLLTAPVWANKAQNPSGSDTESDYQQLYDGFADTRAFIDKGYVDFIFVQDAQTLQSAEDDGDNFTAAANWWDALASQYDLPLYFALDSENTDAALASRVFSLSRLPAYKGSAFTSIESLAANTDGTTASIVAALKGSAAELPSPPAESGGGASSSSSSYASSTGSNSSKVTQSAPPVSRPAASSSVASSSAAASSPVSSAASSSESFPAFKILWPPNADYTTDTQEMTITGQADPAQKLYLGGEEIAVDSYGDFSYEVLLSIGQNSFIFRQGEKSLTVSVFRQIYLISAVSHAAGATFAYDGESVVTVWADVHNLCSAAAVSFSGKVYSLTPADDPPSKDGYMRMAAKLKLPASKDQPVSLGLLTFMAKMGDGEERVEGSEIVLNKKSAAGEEGDDTGSPAENPSQEFLDASSDENSSQEVSSQEERPGEGASPVKAAGNPVRITKKYAETFPANIVNDNSSPNLFPLPAGALDRIVSSKLTFYVEAKNKTMEYYILASGNRVYAEDLTILNGVTQYTNIVKSLSISNDGYYTYVKFDNTSPVSYKMSVSGSTISVELLDTVSVCGSLSGLNKNPLFSSAVWSGSTLNLTLKSVLLGVTPSYNGSQLVLKFLNPVPPSRATVVLDPGHSDSDPGSENSPKDERVMNRELAAIVKSKLESKGVTVKVIPTPAKISLQDRVDFADNAYADLFVSIHHNSNPSSSHTGTEVFYFNRQSKALATVLSMNVSDALSTKNRGAKFQYYYVTRHQLFPAALVECGFMTNPAEYAKMLSDPYKNAMAQGIADGIVSYLNSNYVSSPTGTDQAW
ncbi:MAG: N-acetylmuramoyl-L-alanine amidase [Oscillospiraceae bacterium]|jgi:N-acetylmuramoyl-L-alanine amidase/uncharacterized lipoprotein YddW (UPF0748 family)|nr:N-acetylmuramoyl-L-alanine amidase [Oscillospiraceae bacterium]